MWKHRWLLDSAYNKIMSLKGESSISRVSELFFSNIRTWDPSKLKETFYLWEAACSLPSAGDCSNIILGVSKSNHKVRGKFKENVIKKNNLGEEEKYFCLLIVNKNNNKN